MEVPLAIPGLLPLAIGAALWARWLRSSRGDVSKIVRHIPLAIVLVMLASLGATAWGLRRAFTAAASADASEKASLLANGIAQAMNATAVGYGVLILTLVILLVATVRSKPRSGGIQKG